MTTFDPNRADRDSSEREAFQRHLEAYGSDRSRWPAADRLRFAQLLPRDTAARAMLREATAFDQVLPPASASSSLTTGPEPRASRKHSAWPRAE